MDAIDAIDGDYVAVLADVRGDKESGSVTLTFRVSSGDLAGKLLPCVRIVPPDKFALYLAGARRYKKNLHKVTVEGNEVVGFVPSSP